MPIGLRYENQLLEYFDSLKNTLRMQTLYLGATASGTGSPAGGYAGYLPQTRVSYDPIEAATLATPTSGTLLDNLNHIRYLIATLSGATVSGTYGNPINVTISGVNVVSNVSTLEFLGAVAVADGGDGTAEITINSSGGSGSGASSLNELSDVTLTTISGDEILRYDSSSSKWISSELAAAGIATAADLTGDIANLSAHMLDLDNPHQTTAGASSLATLTDVALTTISGDEILKYDNSSSKWISSELAGAGIATANDLTADIANLSAHTNNIINPHSTKLNNLGDTTITTLSGDEIMQYNSVSSKWVSTSIPTAGIATAEALAADIADLVAHLADLDNPHETTTSGSSSTVTLSYLHEHVYQEDLSAMCNGIKTSFITANEFEPYTTRVTLNGLSLRHGTTHSYYEASTYDEIIIPSGVAPPYANDELILEYITA